MTNDRDLTAEVSAATATHSVKADYLQLGPGEAKYLLGALLHTQADGWDNVTGDALQVKLGAMIDGHYLRETLGAAMRDTGSQGKRDAGALAMESGAADANDVRTLARIRGESSDRDARRWADLAEYLEGNSEHAAHVVDAAVGGYWLDYEADELLMDYGLPTDRDAKRKLRNVIDAAIQKGA